MQRCIDEASKCGDGVIPLLIRSLVFNRYPPFLFLAVLISFLFFSQPPQPCSFVLPATILNVLPIFVFLPLHHRLRMQIANDQRSQLITSTSFARNPVERAVIWCQPPFDRGCRFRIFLIADRSSSGTPFKCCNRRCDQNFCDDDRDRNFDCAIWYIKPLPHQFF